MRRAVAFVALCAARHAAEASPIPPWSETTDVPVPRWARSVAPRQDDTPVFRGPARDAARRGSLSLGARPPLYGATRGPGCEGRWLTIGPFAWVCSDEAEFAADDPPAAPRLSSLPRAFGDDGLAFRYAFVGPEGASGFRDLAHVEQDLPEVELDPGFAVAIAEEAGAFGRRWWRTTHGLWIATDQLNVAHPLTLHGDLILAGDRLDAAWVTADHAVTYTDARAAKASGVRVRFELVREYARETAPAGAMVRVSADDAPAEWMSARDLAAARVSSPPVEVGADAHARWIDVDLATQTLVAYEGTRPQYAALISTGRGAQGTETATPVGVHRIWVKLLTSTMGNLGDEDAETHYSIEDVPYVQFFAKGVALHGAFWHHAFGHAHSHGCVNLAPVDARWLFEFTAPRLPTGWSAVLPVAPADTGTVVRVR